MNFKDKVVVITGASSGIGEASAIKFAKKNAKVVLVARRKEKTASSTKRNFTIYRFYSSLSV